jgi:hypothetical protein
MQARSLEKDQHDLRMRYEEMVERASSERQDHLQRIAELEDEENRKRQQAQYRDETIATL